MNVDRMTISFNQDGNTLGTTEEVEGLEISVETQGVSLSSENERFFVLRTNGWSFDSSEELKNIVDKLITACKVLEDA